MSLPGFGFRLAHGTLPVVRIHYSANPTKRPGTPEGDKWLERAVALYPGGMASPRWRREMEIDYLAGGGEKVFPFWDQWVKTARIVIPAYTPVGAKLYGSFDYGWRNPSAFHVHAVDRDGDITTLWECYGSKIPVPHLAKIIKGQSVVTPDGRPFQGNPYADRMTWIVADPSLWAEDQPMTDGTVKSIAWMFRRAGVHLREGDRGGDTTVADWLTGHWWADPMAPRYRITANCPKLIWELGRLRHKEISGTRAISSDQPEAIVDKDNHAWDGVKMLLKEFPPSPQEQKAQDRPGTFAWWAKLAEEPERATSGVTYRREMVG